MARSTPSRPADDLLAPTGPLVPEAEDASQATRASQPCALVVIYTRNGASLGWRIPVTDGLTIGRDSSSDVVLDSERLSRRHCQLRRLPQGWVVQDLRSTNGTYINGQRVEQAPLAPGDHLEIGGAILEFIAGDDLEAQYHEAIYRMTLVDGLTGLSNRRHLLEVLERETVRSRRYLRPLSLVLLHIDQFQKVNERYGTLAGDYLLRSVAEVLRGELRRDDVIGRYGADIFMALLPETNRSGLREVAEGLRTAVQMSAFEFDGETIKVTTSVGAATYNPEWDVATFVQAADEAARVAKQKGRNRTVVASGSRPGGTRELTGRLVRILDGQRLLRHVLARESTGPVLAFELEDEATLHRCVGQAGVEAWLNELCEDLLAVTQGDDLIGRWRPHSVLLALASDRKGRTEERVIKRVQERFCRRPVPEGLRGLVERGLRAASLPGEDVLRHGEAAGELLVGYLLGTRGLSESLESMPFPVAAPLGLVPTRPTRFGRVRTICDGIDDALRFLVAAQLALLVQQGDSGALVSAGRLILPHQKRSLERSDWEELAYRLARLLPDDRDDGLCLASRALVGPDGARSPLAEQLRAAVAYRPEPPANPELPATMEVLAREERRQLEVLQALIDALRPLGRLRLVSVTSIEAVDRGEDITYGLRLLRGTVEHFPPVLEEVRGRLRNDEVYLLREPGKEPLPLSPLAFVKTCASCGRVELFLADRPLTGPERARVPVRSVTSGHEAAFEVPWTAPVERLHRAMMAARE